MLDNYILDERGNPVVEPDLLKWAKWFQDCRNDRIVARTTIAVSYVSTVFLSLDHSWSDGPPILWETMVFGGPLASEQTRCSGSREQAEAMHECMVQRVKKSTRWWHHVLFVIRNYFEFPKRSKK